MDGCGGDGGGFFDGGGCGDGHHHSHHDGGFIPYVACDTGGSPANGGKPPTKGGWAAKVFTAKNLAIAAGVATVGAVAYVVTRKGEPEENKGREA